MGVSDIGGSVEGALGCHALASLSRLLPPWFARFPALETFA